MLYFTIPVKILFRVLGEGYNFKYWHRVVSCSHSFTILQFYAGMTYFGLMPSYISIYNYVSIYWQSQAESIFLLTYLPDKE